MPKSLNDILGDSVLTEDIRVELTEAFESRIDEQREEVKAELREEFANRYDNDKTQLVEAMDAMLKDAIRTELEEFAQDRAQVVKERVHFKKTMRTHANKINEFVKQVLTKELSELREDRKTHKKSFKKLEEFVLSQLTRELNDFHTDKQALAEQKVRMVREGKKVIETAKTNFMKRSASALQKIVREAMTKEILTLREDIQKAKENEFGRKIFETFASEFMSSTLSESTQVGKLAKEILVLKQNVSEASEKLNAKNKELQEAKRDIRITKDLSQRKDIMNELLQPLNKNHRDIMHSLLETVKTPHLKGQFKKYLPTVINEEEKPVTKKTQTLTESRSHLREINGNQGKTSIQTETGGSNANDSHSELEQMRKLAGLN